MIVSIELIVKFVPVFFAVAFIVVVVFDDAVVVVVAGIFGVVDAGCVSVPPFLAVVLVVVDAVALVEAVVVEVVVEAVVIEVVVDGVFFTNDSTLDFIFKFWIHFQILDSFSNFG